MRGLSTDGILNRVNQIIVPDNESFMFVTLFCVIMNIDTGEIEFSNGGHNPPLISTGSGGFEFLEVPKGLVVGVNDGARFELGKKKLKPGDCIFIYTDGVTEAMNLREELYSEKRLKGDLSAYTDTGMPELIRGIRAKLRDFAQGAMQSDDITMLALRFRGS
jgi:sigma-B regulation protein RsbU (phosphoserine phosphatase)